MTTRYTRNESATAPKRSAAEARPNVPIRTGEHELEAWSQGERFAGRELPVSRMAGASQVRVNIMVVPPGKQSCPFHYHLLEEEHFFVLEGSCVLRSGDDHFTVKPGDYVCFPANQGVGHSFENPFDEDCRMLAIGPAEPAEVAVYPDSGKAKLRAVQTIIRWPPESLDYWDGEQTDSPVTPQERG